MHPNENPQIAAYDLVRNRVLSAFESSFDLSQASCVEMDCGDHINCVLTIPDGFEENLLPDHNIKAAVEKALGCEFIHGGYVRFDAHRPACDVWLQIPPGFLADELDEATREHLAGQSIMIHWHRACGKVLPAGQNTEFIHLRIGIYPAVFY